MGSHPWTRSMDTETQDITSTMEEEEELVGREEEAITEEEEEEKEEITTGEEEPRSEEYKEEDNMIVDIESASEDDADGDTDKQQEDHDHQSDSVKSEDSAINEEALKNKLKKKASVVFERKASDGSSFWSLSARNSVTSMFEGASEQTEDDPEAAEAQNPRKMLQKKRSSLAHKPEPSLLERKESIQQPETVYEFQKVRLGGLKPVDNQSREQKKDAEETGEDKNNGDSVEISGKKCDSISDGKSIKGAKKSKASVKADEKKKVSTTSTSGDKTSSAVGGKKKPITQKPGVPQKDSKSPAGVSGMARTSSTRHKDSSKNVPKLKTASESDNTPQSSNEGKKKPKSETPPSKSQTRVPVERTMSARTSLGPKSDSKSDLKRTTSLRKQEQKPPVTGAATRTAAARSVTKTGSKSNIKDNLDIDNSVTFRSRTKRTPPPVAPKPRAGDKIDLKDLASATAAAGPSPTNKKAARSIQQERKSSAGKTASNLTSLETKGSSVKPVMKKMAAKTSIAEMAKLADTQKVAPPASSGSGAKSKFVSHARATLSPAPARKQRPIETVESDTESVADKMENKEKEEESGIVSESVSASSVILMFGGTGKFKKTPGAANKESEEGKAQDTEKSNEQIFKSTKKLSSVKKVSTSSKTSTESSRKKSQPTKKSSVDSKTDRKTSNPRKSSQKTGDNNVIKTSLTVRLKSKNTEPEEKTQKIISNDEDVLSKHGDTSHSAISTTEFDFKMSADKSR